MRADRRNPTIAALRRFKPTKFEVTLRDGTKKDVPLSTKQNKWEQLETIIDGLAWVTIEAQNDKGETLGVVEDEAPDDGDLVDVDPVEQLERIAKIMADTCLRVMTTTQTETRKMFADSMRANGEVLGSVVESMRVVQDSYSMALKIQAATGAGEGGEDDGVMQMMKMAMAMKFGGPMPSLAPKPMKAATPKATNGTTPIAK